MIIKDNISADEVKDYNRMLASMKASDIEVEHRASCLDYIEKTLLMDSACACIEASIRPDFERLSRELAALA